MTRIAFTADLHVDAYGQNIDPATGLNARLVDYLNTLRFVATEAIERDCDALVVAGDFTERRHPAPWLVSKIQEALDEAPERLILVRGNHDGEVAGGSIVTVLGAGLSSESAFARPGIAWVRRTAICCIPYLDRHWLRTQPAFADVPEAQLFAVLADQFMVVARALYAQAHLEHPDLEGCVLVCHQTLAGAQLSESQQAFLGDQQLVVSATDLAAIGFEGIVAGHLHRHQVLSADPPVLYPGSIERVDFGEEGEAKGFIVADVGPGRFDWEFVETPARRYVTLTSPRPEDAFNVSETIVRCVDVDPDVDVAALRRLLEADGAFEIASIEMRPVEGPISTGGLSESLTPESALESYFEGDADRDELVSHGRRILEAVR